MSHKMVYMAMLTSFLTVANGLAEPATETNTAGVTSGSNPPPARAVANAPETHPGNSPESTQPTTAESSMNAKNPEPQIMKLANIGQLNVTGNALAMAELVFKESDYTYKSTGKRDPFALPASMTNVQEEAPTEFVVTSTGEKRDRELLESFPLDSLKLVGILSVGGHAQAVIEEPEGKAHRVIIGNYLGTNEGRIIDISEGQVILEEKNTNPLKIGLKKTTILSLHEEQ